MHTGERKNGLLCDDNHQVITYDERGERNGKTVRCGFLHRLIHITNLMLVQLQGGGDYCFLALLENA